MDKFETNSIGLLSPGFNAAELAANDNADLLQVTRALWVGESGDISVVLAGGDTVLFTNVSGWMPIRISRLLETGTTASGIVGVW